MKTVLVISLSSVMLLSSCQTVEQAPKDIITTDIANFWEAYGLITSTGDSVLQYKFLDSLFLQKGTDGLTAIGQARNYTPQEYLHAIRSYPKFWGSVRENTLRADQFATEIEQGIEKLRALYPDLKPAEIYLTIGALRTNGTVLDGMVLIGSELAMADKNTVSSEFPEEVRENRRRFFDTKPIDDIVLLTVHEYIHTQQNPLVHNVLSYVIYEGVAEFVSSQALGVPSAVPAIEYGKNNADRVRERFEHEMFYINNQYKWLFGDAPNEFEIRDLGYYVGYQMCENYYDKAEDKMQAIKKMIELDFTNEEEIEEFVQTSGYFSKSLDELYMDFEEKRPYVVGIKQFENDGTGISPRISEITIEFSEPLTGYHTGVDFGELGQEAFPKNDVSKRYWSEDSKSWTMSVELEPNKRYQILISNNFRTEDAIPLRHYLIDFETGSE